MNSIHSLAYDIAHTFFQAMGGGPAYARGDEAVITEIAASLDFYAAKLAQPRYEGAMSQRQYIDVEVQKYGKKKGPPGEP